MTTGAMTTTTQSRAQRRRRLPLRRRDTAARAAVTAATETGAATTSPEPFEGRLAREAARSHGAALFAEHGTLIQRICRHLLRDEFEAEDAAQQTFLSAY